MSPPAKTCRTCFWYRRENMSRDLPTHGTCVVAAPFGPTHANSRGCVQWMPTAPDEAAAAAIARGLGLTPPERA